MPNYFNIEILQKPKNVSDIQLSLYTSFVVTSVFYIFINLIPDYVNHLETVEKELPIRCNLHREVQLFVSDIVHLWAHAIKEAAAQDDTIDLNEIKSIEDMFDEKLIIKVAKNINMYANSHEIDFNRKPLTWKTTFISASANIISKGQRLLDKHKNELLPDIYNAIRYIIDGSVLICLLNQSISVLSYEYKNEMKLIDAIPKEIDGTYKIKDDSKKIETVYNWVNTEYDYLTKKTSKKYQSEIYAVEISNYLC